MIANGADRAVHHLSHRAVRVTLSLCLAISAMWLFQVPKAAAATQVDPPVFAHYYIWFTPDSWNRGKSDFPLAGRYSSDDVEVMERHVREAKAAGLTGFIVSWKSSDDLNRRLSTLIEISEDYNFKLAITYQGLDFNREKLPPSRIASDLQFFVDNFGESRVFDYFGKPVVILTGTEFMTRAEVSESTATQRERIQILASSKSPKTYTTISDLVDGEHYYWSSVNPGKNSRYEEKLEDFAATVRSTDGLWFAPVAPGFDARGVGGRSVVERADGEVLNAEWNAAVATSPDAVVIISWNEFSENTHIEPSERYGNRYLYLVSVLIGTPIPEIAPDSSDPGVTGTMTRAVLALVVTVSVLLASLFVVGRRGWRRGA